ncbi:PAS domain S-box protein [Corallococcus soli]|uniref:PAS domain S-box protein n=1 Tax=Corallococcus soli TaxID=2710757 RepID=UPI001D04D584|nr:PAS domain S-box protein [Corallococcus soli]
MSDAPTSVSAAALSFLAGGGELGERMRRLDWSSTPLPPPSAWPQSLRTMVRLLLDATTPMFVLWGQELCYLYNDAYRPFIGAQHPALARPCSRIWPDIWPQLEPLMKRTLSGETVSFEDLPLTVTRQGYPEEVWFTFSYVPVRDDAGVISGVFCAPLETTARKRAEREKEDALATLRLAQRAGGVGVFELDRETQTVFTSEEFCRIWGMPARPSYMLQELLARLHPDDRPRVRTLEGVVAGSALEPIEYRVRRDDTGEERWIARRGEAPREGVRRLPGVVYDVTEQKRAEAALQVLTARLEQQLSARTAEHDRLWRLSQELMMVCAYDGTIITVNPSATRILGWTEAEMVGRTLTDFVHPEDLPATIEKAHQLNQGRTLLAFQNRYRCRDGGWRVLDWTAVPAEGLIHAVARDITQEREAGQALRQAEEALRQSQKMEAVGQLTGGIAHDFNNLLQGIIGSLDLVQKRVSQGRTDELGRFITGAKASAHRAAALTHRLLAFARRQPLDPRPTDVNQRVRSMEDLLRRTLGENIRLELELTPSPWTTLCDPNQLESAILNLVINARDAMPDGGHLHIATQNLQVGPPVSGDLAPGAYVRLSVTDSGTGMPPEVIARAFEPFFTTKPQGQGTGLGLSMIYGFARQSEGTARIESTPGQGTTVSLLLPRTLDTATREPALAQGLGEEHRARGGEVVVLVEDEPVVRALILEVLQEWGYRVREAEDGPAALRVLEDVAHVDLLVTDIGLPGGMDGRQLAEVARRRRPDLRVLLMTGHAQAAAQASGFLLPGMEMVTKPVAMDVLVARVRRMLEGA